MFREYFKFPLIYDYGLVFTADYNRAFDFPIFWLYPNAFFLDEKIQKQVVDLLNNPTIKFETKTHLNLRFDETNAIIYQDNKEFIIIRSWGRLTGLLDLDNETAIKIQTEFANYIIETLTK